MKAAEILTSAVEEVGDVSSVPAVGEVGDVSSVQAGEVAFTVVREVRMKLEAVEQVAWVAASAQLVQILLRVLALELALLPT